MYNSYVYKGCNYMKKRNLFIALLSSFFLLTACGGNKSESGGNNQSGGNNNSSQTEGDGGGTTDEAKIKEIVLKDKARTTLSATEKISTTAFFEIHANKGKSLKTADKRVKISSSDPEVLKVINTEPVVSTYLEALKPGKATLTIQSNIQEDMKLVVEMTVIDAVFDRQMQDGFFGNNWDNVDFTHEIDEVNPYIKTIAEDGVNHQFYFRDSYVSKCYAECEFTFLSEQDGSAHLPKLGFVFSTQEENDTHMQSCSMIYFNTDCRNGNTTYTDIGYNEIANAIWGWDKGGTDPAAKSYGVYKYESGVKKGEAFKMGVVKEGYNYHIYFNGNYVKSIETTKSGFSVDSNLNQAAPTTCGLFDFKSEVKYSNYKFITDETEVNALIPVTPDFTDIHGA